MDKVYTLKEVEELLKVSNRTLLNYIKAGKLNAVKIGRKWMVTEENIKKLLDGK